MRCRGYREMREETGPHRYGTFSVRLIDGKTTAESFVMRHEPADFSIEQTASLYLVRARKIII